ncbi:hypothetical protein B7P43_G10923 [Cryptotermes secundus]|uniref:BED-type domain-containing protein n=1 Tax=Cryptotermes secundus TaxID=105785 RepID=A0A2J7Q9U4_9NEOP|nr:hypothetical protein B7P43_G10923 [Cryptotermes secundus]
MSYLTYLVSLLVIATHNLIVSVAGANKKLWPDSESESDGSSKESVGSNTAGRATWGKVDKTPALGQFTGNPGVSKGYICYQCKQEWHKNSASVSCV